MNKLLIVESPNKIKKLKTFLGSEWDVKASVGHIADLSTKKGIDGLGLEDFNRFKPIYEVSKEKEDVVKTLKQAIIGKEVYLAMDPDREGEAIASNLQHFLKLKDNYKRVTFSQITKDKVLEAIKNFGKIDKDLVRASETRRAIDRIYGFKGSGILRSHDKTLKSVGRVQSAGLKIVVDREREIKAFQVTKYEEPEITVDGNIYKLSSSSMNKQEKIIHNWTDTKWESKALIKDVIKKEVFIPAPKPLTTNGALRLGASLGMKANETTRALQEIFESGMSTYIRTDNPNLSIEAIEEIKEYLSKKGIKVQSPVRKNKMPDGAQEGHEAIRPSHLDGAPDGLSFKAKQLYKAILERTLASVAADGIDIQQKASFEANGYEFVNISKVVKELNWREITKVEKEYKVVVSKDFSEIVEGEREISVEMVAKKTKAPSRYSESSFLSKLEKEGIGRPSTYSSMLSIIQLRKYVELSKKNLVPTESGNKVIAFLEESFNSFVQLGFTKKMEESLDRVSQGKDHIDVLKNFYETFNKDYLEAFKAIQQEQIKKNGACKKCGSALVVIKGKFGEFKGCSNYRECK